jgi:PhnB protein
MGIVSPQTLGGSPVTIHLYVPDVDALVARAVAAGATLVRPVADEFYGDRAGRLSDPFGHVWHLASRKEDVSATELRRRFDALYAK